MGDNSHMSRLLSMHPQLNPKLYAKNTSILTTVANQGLIAQARADNFEGLSVNGIIKQDGEDDNGLVFSSEAIVKPNPDSISGLIAKQIKVYETKSGDTLKSIAANFGLSTNTIIWANKLPGTQIKPGWQLLIPPTDGIIVTANSNTTLPDLAKKYKVSLETIIAYNGLADAEAFEEGQIIILPGGIMPQPAPKPTPRNTNDGKVKPEGVIKPKIVNNGTGHIFPWGYCTWYVATKVHIPFGGNAKLWLKNAQGFGIQTGKVPVPGAVVVTNESKYGHVAFIESVSENSFVVSEMNYEKFGKINKRTISKTSKAIKGYIYP